jgi:hypothetical protein
MDLSWIQIEKELCSCGRSIFCRLQYPENYFDNFVTAPSSSKGISGAHLPNTMVDLPRSLAPTKFSRTRRVLSWIPKCTLDLNSKSSKPAPGKGKRPGHLNPINKGPFMNKAPSKESPSLEHSNLSPSALANTRPEESTRPDQQPTVTCTKCLGPGHLRKDCTQSVRCNKCFNYGHTSHIFFSRFRSERRFRPVSHSEGEGAWQVHLYDDAPLSLDASVPPIPLFHPPLKTPVHRPW